MGGIIAGGSGAQWALPKVDKCYIFSDMFRDRYPDVGSIVLFRNRTLPGLPPSLLLPAPVHPICLLIASQSKTYLRKQLNAGAKDLGKLIWQLPM